MNRTQYLLLKIAEEANEVAVAAMKAMQFGLDETNHLKPDGPNNRGRLIEELNDLEGILKMAVADGILPDWWSEECEQKAKVEKVDKYYAMSQVLGQIKNGPTAAEMIAWMRQTHWMGTAAIDGVEKAAAIMKEGA